MRILVVFEEDIAGIKVETASPQDVLKPLRERRNKGFPSWVFTENKVPSEGLFRIAVTLSDEHIYSYAQRIDRLFEVAVYAKDRQ
ncbi:hypothetical protein ACFLRX_06990 [Acidobacteriota bacterium]